MSISCDRPRAARRAPCSMSAADRRVRWAAPDSSSNQPFYFVSPLCGAPTLTSAKSKAVPPDTLNKVKWLMAGELLKQAPGAGQLYAPFFCLWGLVRRKIGERALSRFTKPIDFERQGEEILSLWGRF